MWGYMNGDVGWEKIKMLNVLFLNKNLIYIFHQHWMSIHTSSEVEYVIPFSAKDHKKQKDILPY